MIKKDVYIYVMRDSKTNEEFTYKGTLPSFIKENKNTFGEFSSGKRRALQNTLKRKSSYKGFTVISVEKIKKEEIKKEHAVEICETPIANSDGVFVLKSKSREIEIDREVVREMLQLYCTRRLTQEETANQLGLLREEVSFVLSKFKIIKNSIPFIQEDIDTMSTDEMAEIVRMEKKRGFKRKLSNNKHIDQEKELKKLHTKQYYFDRFTDAVKGIKSVDVNNYDCEMPKVNNRKTIVATLTDEHFGSTIDSPFNKFNKEIASARMEEYTRAIIKRANNLGAERVVIEQLGDLVEGIIHISGRITTDMDGIQSCVFASQVISKMLIEIKVNTNAVVEFYSVHGNHDRIISNKTESLEEENFERFITYAIDLIVKNSRVKNITINLENLIFGMSLIPMYGKYIAGSHGHNIRKQENALIELSRRGYSILQYHQGHFHNLKIENKGETVVITSPSFVGSNSYASKMFLVSKPQQLIHTYDENGWIGMDIVELN